MNLDKLKPFFNIQSLNKSLYVKDIKSIGALNAWLRDSFIVMYDNNQSKSTDGNIINNSVNLPYTQNIFIK